MSYLLKITEGLGQLDIVLNEKQHQDLLLFLEHIKKWNRTHNLTAIKSIDEMIVKHLFDSLSISPYLNCQTLLDVGCGAGLPGIPLAIANPAINFNLIDASQKRIVFVKQVKRELTLKNVFAEHQRVENMQPSFFDAIVSRAYASLKEFVLTTQHLLSNNGQWLAMKGAYPLQEISELPENIKVIDSHKLQVPNLEAERHLICMQRAG